MRTPMVIGNWKMNGTLAETRALTTALRDGLKRPGRVEVAVCPPFTALACAAEVLAGSPIMLGAQNCHHAPSGAHTGEISLPMLVELGCRLVLCGHSERRREMGETDEQIKLKFAAVLPLRDVPAAVAEVKRAKELGAVTFATTYGTIGEKLLSDPSLDPARIVG